MNKKPVVEVEQIVPWSVARDAARRTIGKEPLGREKSPLRFAISGKEVFFKLKVDPVGAIQ